MLTNDPKWRVPAKIETFCVYCKAKLSIFGWLWKREEVFPLFSSHLIFGSDDKRSLSPSLLTLQAKLETSLKGCSAFCWALCCLLSLLKVDGSSEKFPFHSDWSHLHHLISNSKERNFRLSSRSSLPTQWYTLHSGSHHNTTDVNG